MILDLWLLFDDRLLFDDKSKIMTVRSRCREGGWAALGGCVPSGCVPSGAGPDARLRLKAAPRVSH